MKYLIIEDDKTQSDTLSKWFTDNLHTVETADNGADGSFLGRSYDYDAIILDYSLPKKDGLVVCKEIRASGKTTPILFLSTTTDTHVKVDALESGADDYLTKPFELSELNARLRALTRRPHELKQPVIQVGDLVLNTDKHTLARNEKSISLTRKEFNLIEYLMKNVGNIVSRTAIMDHVWTADSDPFSNTVETHILNLRKKLNAGNAEDMIINVPGRGYILDTIENLKKRK